MHRKIQPWCKITRQYVTCDFCAQALKQNPRHVPTMMNLASLLRADRVPAGPFGQPLSPSESKTWRESLQYAEKLYTKAFEILIEEKRKGGKRGTGDVDALVACLEGIAKIKYKAVRPSWCSPRTSFDCARNSIRFAVNSATKRHLRNNIASRRIFELKR